MIDRVIARALVDAGYMPLSEYLQAFPEANFSSEPQPASGGFEREAILDG